MSDGAGKLLQDDYRIIRLLRFGHFEKRANGGWRFGTKVIADRVVERLVAAGVARQSGERVERTVQQDHAAG